MAARSGGHHDGVADLRLRGEFRLDLGQLDTEATQLDLVAAAAKEAGYPSGTDACACKGERDEDEPDTGTPRPEWLPDQIDSPLYAHRFNVASHEATGFELDQAVTGRVVAIIVAGGNDGLAVLPRRLSSGMI